ncbi:NCS1 nucleoside transporter family protein [Stachybotrys elegans]|uniref:NCS1 nucleoside transporter family protein n=1 Tax=Stachybotrys elegans TaxID=80388 RepID=A0A8K0SKC7_9HYPO|nr:NCS1 nucleoside transporter family protein [Stachybotrys elegans]
MALSSFLQKIELPHGLEGINEDLRPVEAGRRTWTWFTFHNYWLLINCNIATFLTGSALIPLGLNWWQAIIAITIGNIIATAALIISSLPGAYYNIGFAIFSRVNWGIWGSQFAVWNRIFLAFGYGFQAWVGGECFYLILLSWDPRYGQRIPNTIPAETGMTSAQFIAYVIFSIISLPVLWIRPHRIEKFFYVASSVTLVFFVVLLIWALATMGPSGFGDTLDSDTRIPLTGGPNSAAWLMVYGIMSTVGSIAAGIMNQNDYARLSRRPADAIWGQMFAFPIYSIFASVVGILVTAATQKRLGGEAVWNPPTLLAALFEKDPSSGTRAAVFFAGLALVVSQIGSNLPGNALAGGIDLAAVFPRYINIRRGAYIVALLSPIVNPWRLVSTATTFLTVLSGYGVFLAPMTGIMASSYHLVNKQKLNVDDLYRTNSGSIYWYAGGWNWRAPVAWLAGVLPCIPGFVAAIDVTISMPDGATELYYLNYLFGFVTSGVLYYLLHLIFPDAKVHEFVQTAANPKELQRSYREIWEAAVAREVDSVGEESLRTPLSK